MKALVPMTRVEWRFDPDRLVSAWLAAWNAGVPAQRRRHLAACWRADAVFADPTTRLQGLAALDQYIDAVRRGGIAMRFELAAPPDRHHGRVRFDWRLLDGAAGLRLDGCSFGEVGADGRFTQLVAFFDGAAEPLAWRGGGPAAVDALRRPAR